MSFKNSIFSIYNGVCPKCQSQKVFTHNPYFITKVFSMKKTCGNCNTDFEKEPSFYTGAMYVSYGFSVAIVIATFVASIVLFENPDPEYMAYSGIAIAFVFAPLNLRLSRLIWLNIFVEYDPKTAAKYV